MCYIHLRSPSHGKALEMEPYLIYTELCVVEAGVVGRRLYLHRAEERSHDCMGGTQMKERVKQRVVVKGPVVAVDLGMMEPEILRASMKQYDEERGHL